MGTSEKKISARDRARHKVAAQREAQRRRDQLNESDLAVVLKAAEALPGAQDALDKAVAAAHERYRSKVAGAHADMGGALAAMKDRGETVASLAELTEFSEAEVRRLIKTHTDRSAGGSGDDSAQSATREPVAGEPVDIGADSPAEHSVVAAAS